MFDFKYEYKQVLAHSIHSYPAKFPALVPKQIIQNHLRKKNQVILDPFSGCGTTLLEGLINGHNVIGNDINFIGNLIASVKTTIYSENHIKNAYKHFQNLSNYNVYSSNRVVDFYNIDHWFQKNVQKEICFILDKIDKEKSLRLQNLFKVSLSEIIIKVSNQDSDTRYEAIKKDIRNGQTINLYLEKLHKNIEIIKDLSSRIDPKLTSKILCQDTRKLKDVKSDSIDLIVTSPPYANTYDYYLYHKHRMNWLGYDFSYSKSLEIGSRLQFSSKKDDISVWEEDINSFLKEFKRVAKNKSVICLVIGDSVVNKKLFKADDCIYDLSKVLNFKYLYSYSESLSKNTRKFNHKWRSKLDKKEHVIVFQVAK